MRFWGMVLVVLAAGAAIMMWPARSEPAGAPPALLYDTDPHYHVLRAEALLRDGGGAAWRDPALDWPHGADVPWPPLFDVVLAGAGRFSGATSRDGLARAAAIVPPVLGVLSLLLVALLGRALGGEAAGVGAAVLVALHPAHAQLALVGRVDQHVAEVLLASAIALAFLRGARAPRVALIDALFLGGTVAASFWTWMGSTVALLAPASTMAIAYLVGARQLARRAATSLAAGCAAGACLLAGSIAAWGPPGGLARTAVVGVGGLHVAIVAGLATFAGIVAWRARSAAPAWVRAAELAGALGVPAVLLLGTWPGLRQGVAHGLTALAAANPWYAEIVEFRPLVGTGLRPLAVELRTAAAFVGVAPFMAVLAVPGLRSRWRDAPRDQITILHFAVWSCVAFVLAFARNRFVGYASVPVAVAAATGAVHAGRSVAARLGAPRAAAAVASVLLVVTAAPGLPALAAAATSAPRVRSGWIEATTALRALPPSDGDRAGVAGPWSLGHLVRYYADRPTFATPFGTEAGAEALPDWSRFLFATREQDAVEPLVARRVSHVLLANPSHELVGLRGFAPAGAPTPLLVERSVWRGETVTATGAFEGLVASRLYFADGSAGDWGVALERFRLVFEGESTRPAHPINEERIQIWELVPGATIAVRGAPPGTLAAASVDVVTAARRRFRWTSLRLVAADGRAVFRVPYATGPNGRSIASACEVRAGGLRAARTIGAADVLGGAELPLTLAARTR